jgi:hypothetical protein
MEIQLTQGKVATIDDEDWPLVAPYKWHARRDVSTGRFYACTKEWQPETGKHKRIIMHRLIMGAKTGEMVDHRDRDRTLDNRRSSLRICDNARNQQNRGPEAGTSKYKCVSWISQKRKWRVRFKWLGKDYFVGYFKDEKEAALAYNAAILPLAGEFAVLNQVA